MRLRVIPAALVAAAFLALGGASAAAAAPAAPAAAPVAAPVVAPAAPAGPSGVDDFSFDSFDADYTLGRDADDRSTLTTVETLVARFPDFDQNRGIVRYLVDTYDGHPTDLHVVSVTDAEGAAVPYTSETEDGVVALALGTDDFVHGVQTYVITYTQRNVTRFYADTNAQEFYWDVNGTGWAQPFGQVTADVHLDDDLLAATTGGVDAVAGFAGSEDSATITPTEDGWSFAASELGPYQTLTFAIGFEPGTFAERDSGFFAEPWPTLAAVSALLALFAVILAAIVRVTRLRDAPGRPTVIAEYLPPEGLSIPMAATVVKHPHNPITAELLQLAMIGRMRVVEQPASGGWGSKPAYVLQYLDGPAPDQAWRYQRRAGATPDDLAALHAVFGGQLQHGESRSLGQRNESIGNGLRGVLAKAKSAAVGAGLRRKRPAGLIALVFVLGALGLIGSFVFAVVAADRMVGGEWPWLGVGVAVVAEAVALVLIAKQPYDARGAELRDHLAGLDLYIRLAEADRIRVLQSPQGAQREQIAADDPSQVLELTERLLPWAVLLGHEREWSEVLGRAYEQVGGQPDWYVGSHPFTSVGFTSAMSGISSSSSASFASSSSSGGSGGGASAGGGGGGGGGGGR